MVWSRQHVACENPRLSHAGETSWPLILGADLSLDSLWPSLAVGWQRGVRTGSACLPGKNCGIRRVWTFADLHGLSCIVQLPANLFFSGGREAGNDNNPRPRPTLRQEATGIPKPRARRSRRIGNSIVKSWLSRECSPLFSQSRAKTCECRYV